MRITQLNKVQRQLSEFVEYFGPCLGRLERKHWCKMYLSGLLLDGDRKSIQPMAERLEGGNLQALQQFVKDSPWDSREVQHALYDFMVSKFMGKGKRDWILDDTGLPKKGKASVGVGRQYCGATGKIDNCQSIVSWQCSSQKFHFPVVAQLYLPESWTGDEPRMAKVGVPIQARSFQEKWRIALNLLDDIGDPDIDTLLFDAGYGSNRVFLNELDERKRQFVGQIRGIETFWPGDIALDYSSTHASGQGRRRKYPQVADKRLKPKSAESWARELFSSPKTVRVCTIPLNKPKKVEYVAMRVYETIARPFRRVGAARWLVIEKLSDGSLKYYVSNYSEDVSPRNILIKGHKRWEIEQGYQQLKEELGLDHYEGRSWRGLHHHITLCFMAFCFLQMLRHEQKKSL